MAEQVTAVVQEGDIIRVRVAETIVDVAATLGTQGATGAPGSKILFGAGAPDNGDGVNDDVYFNTSNGDVYQKVTGAWVLQDNMTGPTGATGDTGATGPDGLSFRQGSGAPSNGLGNDDDTYMDIDTGDIYLKAAGAWGPTGNVAGFALIPSNNLSDVDDVATACDNLGLGSTDNVTFADITGDNLAADDADIGGMSFGYDALNNRSFVQATNTNSSLLLYPDGTGYVRLGFQDQPVGVNQIPGNDAAFEVFSTSNNKGSRPAPSMTTAQKEAISSPANGLQVYDTDLDRYEYYHGPTSSWRGMGGGGGGASSLDFYDVPELAPAPIDSVLADGNRVKLFNQFDEQALFCRLRVPDDYVAGQQISLTGGLFAADMVSTGDVLFTAETAIIRAGVATGTLSHTSTNAEESANNTSFKDIGDIDLTNATGEIGGSPVAAKDVILIKIYRNVSAESASHDGDARLLLESFQPKFSA